jgi:hypothetical protein
VLIIIIIMLLVLNTNGVLVKKIWKRTNNK